MKISTENDINTFKQTKLTLQILAKDILENDYTDSSECPITRALARSGRPDLYDVGGLCIKESANRLFDCQKNDGYLELTKKVVGMYSTKVDKLLSISLIEGEIGRLPIEDFEITIYFSELK